RGRRARRLRRPEPHDAAVQAGLRAHAGALDRPRRRLTMELVEREPYLERLEACLQQARAGSGRLVLLGGEAGAGKTSLARRFVEGRADRVRVLWGACDPLSTPRAPAPFS